MTTEVSEVISIQIDSDAESESQGLAVEEYRLDEVPESKGEW